MSELIHRIKVFVFSMRRAEPRYLLLKASQGIESFWGPLQGTIGFGEKLDTAIRREVMDEAGILRPVDVIDLQMPSRWVVGDEEIIEWTYGLRTVPPQAPLQLDKRWAEFQWANFSLAYPSLELEIDRAAILRLHTIVQAA
jgi:8-oxo-dGTP pyrophosphatase MutT (NUDIX family)